MPIAAWCGVLLAEVLLRRRDYAEADLYDPRGRYGGVRWIAVLLVVVGTFLGWGLVTNTFAGWLGWQGYLLGPLGRRRRAPGPSRTWACWCRCWSASWARCPLPAGLRAQERSPARAQEAAG